ncbi:MAG TPA: hypothetical protein VJB92_01490 [Candidatus Paceibacterota bacterium]
MPKPKAEKNLVIIILALFVIAVIVGIYYLKFKPEKQEPLTNEQVIQKWLNMSLPGPENIDPRVIKDLTAPE